MNPLPINLSEMVLWDAAGAPARLGDVVDGPTILDLVRYYGCAPCVSQMWQLSDRHDEIVARGGAVVAIGPAAPYQARLLADRGIGFPLLLDPEGRIAEQIGLTRQSLGRFLFDVRGWGRWLAAWFRKGRQGRITAGYGALPAVLVLDGSARVVWMHRGRYIGDYPPLDTTLQALDDAVRAARRG